MYIFFFFFFFLSCSFSYFFFQRWATPNYLNGKGTCCGWATVADTDGCEGFGKRARRSECGKIKKKSHEEEEPWRGHPTILVYLSSAAGGDLLLLSIYLHNQDYYHLEAWTPCTPHNLPAAAAAAPSAAGWFPPLWCSACLCVYFYKL